MINSWLNSFAFIIICNNWYNILKSDYYFFQCIYTILLRVHKKKIMRKIGILKYSECLKAKINWVDRFSSQNLFVAFCMLIVQQFERCFLDLWNHILPLTLCKTSQTKSTEKRLRRRIWDPQTKFQSPNFSRQAMQNSSPGFPACFRLVKLFHSYRSKATAR